MKKLGLTLIFVISSIGYAADGPINIPVGERVYIDSGELWEPLLIVPKDSGKKGVLDPNQNQKEDKPAPVQQVERAPTKAKQPSSLVFDKVNIRGRLSQPRVKFGRERLEVGRVDQRVNTSRFNRIFQVRRGEL